MAAYREQIEEMIGERPPNLEDVVNRDYRGSVIMDPELKGLAKNIRQNIISMTSSRESWGTLTLQVADMLILVGYASEETLVKLLQLYERDMGFHRVLELVDCCFFDRIPEEEKSQKWKGLRAKIEMTLKPFLAQLELERGKVLSDDVEQYRFVNSAIDRLDDFERRGETPPGFSEEFLEECQQALALYLSKYSPGYNEGPEVSY